MCPMRLASPFIFIFLYFRGRDCVADALILQSYGIKVGYGGIPGPSGGRDGSSSQGGGCCS
jgi:hypothetical protein